MLVEEGTVVVVGTGQVGTVVHCDQQNVTVLLANLCLWYGKRSQVYIPQTTEELAAAPVEVDRFEERERTGKKKPRKRSEEDDDGGHSG